MGLEAGGRGGTKKKEKKKEEEEEKIPHMCESIGHRPLRGRCPKRGTGVIAEKGESRPQIKISFRLVKKYP